MLDSFESQPKEILLEIFKHISYFTRIQTLTRVCKKWNNAVKDPMLISTDEEKLAMSRKTITMMQYGLGKDLFFYRFNFTSKSPDVQKIINWVNEALRMGVDPSVTDECCANYWQYRPICKHSLLQGLACANLGELANVLISKGAKVNHQDKDGLTALHLAAMEGHIEMAKLLCINGADITLLDNKSKTAADWAIDRGYIDLATAIQNSFNVVSVANKNTVGFRSS